MTTRAFFDIDGVLTDGSFLYTNDGKAGKLFSTGDSDALKILSTVMEVKLVSADLSGMRISEQRANDIRLPILKMSPRERASHFHELRNSGRVFYMGDSALDSLVFESVDISACPADADPLAKAAATFVTSSNGGKRAVSEACFRLLEMIGVSAGGALRAFFEQT